MAAKRMFVQTDDLMTAQNLKDEMELGLTMGQLAEVTVVKKFKPKFDDNGIIIIPTEAK